ncbi:MAG: homoserine O-succinyltransferase [Lachnospiraceae bacterium]|nr:homoserine O-succinyltransferase [Lachnospiraceae bacterium]
MPIKTQSELPAKEILENENIFVMDENRAMHQDIRPLQVLILNIMPVKQDTELQLLRALSNTPLQIDVTFMNVRNHISKNTPASHLNKFYVTFDEVKEKKYDGMIITGAPVEDISFEEVDYWDEICEVFDWTKDHVTSTLHICWAAQAAFYHYYGINKRQLPQKLFGVYEHRVSNRKIPLVRGFDDVFLAPHSRHTETPAAAIHACEEITVLAESDAAGVFLAIAEGGRKIFVNGHPEYDRYTLRNEYERDLGKGLNIQIPYHYFPEDDPTQRPLLQWRSHSNNLYSNWLNYYVYQVTPYDLNEVEYEGMWI